jgi:hypothetical protein
MLKHYVAAMILGIVMLAPGTALQARDRINYERAVAIHECSALAQRYPETTFSSTEFELYRACMARHGQPE